MRNNVVGDARKMVVGNHKDALASWYKGKSGSDVFALEQRLIAPIVDHFRPFRCLELASRPLVMPEQVKEKVNFSSTFNLDVAKSSACVVGDVGALPFSSEYFDLVVCCHVHEVNSHSAKTISELSRVLMPEGLIAFVGFNPHGIWRKRDFYGMNKWWCNPMDRENLVALAGLCSLEEVYTDYAGFLDVCDRQKGLQFFVSSMLQRYFPESGILYKTVMRKRVSAFTAAAVVSDSMMHNTQIG